MCVMATVGVRELRQNLSKYLRRVARGEAFRVTDRGRPVATLGPLPEESTPLDRLVASGKLIRCSLDLVSLGQPQDFPAQIPISKALDQERSET